MSYNFIKESILEIPRLRVVALSQTGSMNIKSATHWDVCKALHEGNRTQEQIADDFHISDRMVRYIKCKKCPDVR